MGLCHLDIEFYLFIVTNNSYPLSHDTLKLSFVSGQLPNLNHSFIVVGATCWDLRLDKFKKSIENMNAVKLIQLMNQKINHHESKILSPSCFPQGVL